MLPVISNVSIFLYLVLFIHKAGRYTSSSLLSERFPWREKQLHAGLSGLLLNFYLTGQKIFAVYIIFIFFLFVESRPSFKAIPPDPFYVLEGNNITFVWQYNLSGTFDRVVFQFSSSTPSRLIVIKLALNIEARVPNTFYQGRIQENINATRAEITIFTLQRSESGEYEIQVTDSNFDPASDKTTVQVQCK